MPAYGGAGRYGYARCTLLGGKGLGTCTISDQDNWAVRLRVNRPFCP